MPYTLAKFFIWGLLAALAGGVIGWLLRSLTARVQIASVRAATVDHEELERLRGRLANLEPAVAERDRLRMELADVRGSTAGALGFASVVEPPIVPLDEQLDDDPLLEPCPDGFPSTESETTESESSESESSESESSEAERDPAASAADSSTAAPEPASDPPLDLAAARSVLGRRIALDDLTVVEGIGPKIAELCAAMGITTWRQLAGTDVAQLQSMLNDAGSRFQTHKPGTWPRQAELLADGAWDEFKDLTDELGGGR